MSGKKAIVVLVIDHDTYATEAYPPKDMPFDDEVLLSFGKEANRMAAHWLGYEAWIVINDAPKSLVDQLGRLNVPLKESK